MTYKTDRKYESNARSRSVTPPHWKDNKTITFAEYEKRKKEQQRKQVESDRRAELRRQRHEEEKDKESSRKARELFLVRSFVSRGE